MTGSPSGFESNDGNMTVEGTNAGDWNCFANGANAKAPGATGFVTSGITVGTGTCNSNLVGANATAIHPRAAEATKGSEVVWTKGTKLDTQCPSLTNKGDPNKDDFTDIAQYHELDSSTPPNIYLYGAETRLTADGSSSGNVELNQFPGPVPGSPCQSQINRTPGDKLLAFDFSVGGTVLDFHALTWVASGACIVKTDSAPCWGANVVSAGSGGITVGGCAPPSTGNDVEGCGNQSTLADSNNGIGNSSGVSPLNAQQFAEFGVNLTKVLGITSCNPFGQEVYESRTSASSFTSEPEDIEFLHQTIATCGSITVIKHTNPRGLNQSFSYSTTGSLTPASFSLNDSGNTTGDSTCSQAVTVCNTQTYANLQAGTYSVTEGTEPGGFAFDNVSCLNNGIADPNVTITSKTATIKLAPNDNVVCTYVNNALGTINIIKHTDPAGVNQNFGFTSNLTSGTASTGTIGSFTLNDSATNEETITNVPAGNYTVTEGTEPTSWTLESLTCSPSTGSSNGVQDGTNSLQADITLAFGGTVTCTYTNRQPGAITITKVSSKSATDFLAGASFELCTNAGPYGTGNQCAAPTGVSNPLPLTPSNGTICVSGLPRLSNSGTTYYVQELSAPTGYAKDTTNHAVLVNQGGTCTTGSQATVTVPNVPLTDLTITATSEATGGTNSQITCTDSSNGNIGNSPSQNQPSANVTANGLKPGTYSCTVVIDP